MATRLQNVDDVMSKLRRILRFMSFTNLSSTTLWSSLRDLRCFHNGYANKNNNMVDKARSSTAKAMIGPWWDENNTQIPSGVKTLALKVMKKHQ